MPEPPPAVRTDDVYVRYYERFGDVPPRRTAPPPPLEQADQFDLGMEAALIEDRQALVAPVRKVRPPTHCWLHDENLIPGFGRISRIANIGQWLTQRFTPFADLRTGNYVDRDIDEAPEYPVAYCPICRAETADWLKSLG